VDPQQKQPDLSWFSPWRKGASWGVAEIEKNNKGVTDPTRMDKRTNGTIKAGKNSPLILESLTT